MNWIPDDLRDFDFCWSCCSLDHLGSLRLAKRFVYNSLACLKPGGIAVHTSEYNLSLDWNTIDYAHTVVWTRYDVEEALAWLRERDHECSFDWTVGNEPEDDILNQSEQCHLRLCLGQFVVTSFGLVIRKSESATS